MVKFYVNSNSSNWKNSSKEKVQTMFDNIKNLEQLQVTLTAIGEPVALTSVGGNIQVNHPYDY